jgi:hypothetical protein
MTQITLPYAAEGTDTDWSSFGTVMKEEAVAADDGDSTYCTISSTGNQTFTVATPDWGGTVARINWVRLYITFKVLGTTGVNRVIIRGYEDGVGFNGPQMDDEPAAYDERFDEYTTRPSTGTEWTQAIVEGMEGGFRAASSGTLERRVTYARIVVDYDLAGDSSVIAVTNRQRALAHNLTR